MASETVNKSRWENPLPQQGQNLEPPKTPFNYEVGGGDWDPFLLPIALGIDPNFEFDSDFEIYGGEQSIGQRKPKKILETDDQIDSHLSPKDKEIGKIIQARDSLEFPELDPYPLDLYTIYTQGRRGEFAHIQKYGRTKRIGVFKRFNNYLRRSGWRKASAHPGENVKEVGDEDIGIFGSRGNDAAKIWKQLDFIQIMLRIYVFLDYMYTFYNHGIYRLATAEYEFAHLKNIYNCPSKGGGSDPGFGDQIFQAVNAFNAFLSFLVLFVCDERSSTVCAYWIGVRWISVLLLGLRYFWLTRFLSNPRLEYELTWQFIFICGFNAIGTFLICYIYYQYSDLLKSRVNRLRGGRVLNLEIDAKYMDEFTQRKVAVRFAGTYQSALLIQKQMKEAKHRGNRWDLDDPGDEECKFALMEGIRAYKHLRGIEVLKIEEAAEKLRRRIRMKKLAKKELHLPSLAKFDHKLDTAGVTEWVMESARNIHEQEQVKQKHVQHYERHKSFNFH